MYADFQSIIVPEDNGKIRESYARNIKSLLIVVIAIDYCVLMIILVSLLSHI